MLTFLQIRDYAIIETLDLDIRDGFTCITGETGAGKSILVGALGLLSGNRADTGAIRSGAKRAELSAGFDLPEGSPALEWLRNSELDGDGECLLRRVIGSNGRSRAWINGTAVTLQQLAELGELLVEIHGQNEHIRLVRGEEQLRLLDGGGGHESELEEVRRCFGEWRALDSERQELLRQKPLDAGDRDLLKYQLRELETERPGDPCFGEISATRTDDGQANPTRRPEHGQGVDADLVGVFETHIHNDYVSGGKRLPDAHGAANSPRPSSRSRTPSERSPSTSGRMPFGSRKATMPKPMIMATMA